MIATKQLEAQKISPPNCAVMGNASSMPGADFGRA
jgi:hypothetical protein